MDLNPILTKIESYMKLRNWSLYKLAQESDIPYSSLNSMFLKNTQPTISTLEKICVGLSISMSDFFADKHLNDVPFAKISDEEREFLTLFNGLCKSDQELFMFYARGFSRKPPHNI